MRALNLIIIIAMIFISCKKEDDRNLLIVEEFELGECFSTLSLNNFEVVITDEQSYFEFQDSIRRHFNPSCDTIYLPEINFNESLFLGKFTQTSGCNAEYNRSVYYNENTTEYEYEILVTSIGDCEMLISSFNCVVVPKQSNSEKVTFKVTQN